MAADRAEREPFSGAVLAGGASSRMGRDKAFVEIDGRTLLQVAVDALADAGAAEVVIVGGDQARIESMGLRFVPDQHPGEGPLGGIVTALAAAQHDIVAVLSCDLMHTEGPAVASVVGALGAADVAIAVVDGKLQTLHGAWRVRVLPHLTAVFASGSRSVKAGLDGLDVVHLLDGDPCWFADADSPGDLPKPTG